MPILRCPSCYYATTTRQDSIEGVRCEKCGTNLFDYYYKGRSAPEAALLIAEKGVEFKKKKAKAERDYKKQNASERPNQSGDGYSESMSTDMSSKESLTESAFKYALTGALILAVSGGFQYFKLRSGVQKTTIELLNENGQPGYKADGITLPLSAAFGGITTAKVFLKSSGGGTQAIDVEVIQKGTPIISIFTGSDFYIEISGTERMRLR